MTVQCVGAILGDNRWVPVGEKACVVGVRASSCGRNTC